MKKAPASSCKRAPVRLSPFSYFVFRFCAQGIPGRRTPPHHAAQHNWFLSHFPPVIRGTIHPHFLPRLPRPLVCRSAINTVPSFNTPFAARRFSSAFVESVSCTVSAFRMLCIFKQFTEPVRPFLSFFIICTVFGRT